MTTNRFQGDPAVKITPNGAKMLFVGGNPIMDAGLENAVTISMYTKKGWWGNVLFSQESQKIGSDVEITALQPIVSMQSINNMTDAIDKALSWMTDTKLAQDYDINVVNPRTDELKAQIIIYPPGRDSQTLLFLKNGLNWISQSQNPANERMKNVL